MILKVEKRDTRKRKFEPKHIYDAIEAAFKESHEQYCDEVLDDLVAKVIASLELLGKKTVPVETIQDTIYAVLKENQYVDTAVAFEEYRRERTRIRMIKSEVMRIIREIKQADLPSSNILRDNANESGGTPAGMYGKIASEVNKMFNLLDVVNRKYAEEHTNGYMHIHDLNQYDLTFNCLFAPVGKLLKSGFDSGTGFQRPAQSIQSATALTAVILQLQSNQQFGGIACDNFDFEMAPFVDRSFLKNLAKELNSYAKKTGDPQYSEFTGRFKLVKKRLIELLKERGVSMNLPVASLYAMFPQDCVDEAIDTTDMSDEEKAKVEELDEKIHDLITSEVSTAISTYYSVVSSEITGSYFSAILQQNEVKGLLGSSTINSSQFEISDVTKFIDASFENVYEANLKYLNSGDENLFDITGAFSK